jgi:nuclear pore complex protein Nup107
LITQLDPDAVTRQHLGLEKQDENYEQATWLTCWKMLRLGRSWAEIRQWAHERLENWRAVSVCGSIEDAGDGKGGDLAFVRMMNFRSQESWRSACLDLANNDKAGNYERAVYALLSGEIEPAIAVCQNWNDFVYVLYNHIIILRYRDFCKRFHRKLNYAPGTKATVPVSPPSYDFIHEFLDTLKQGQRTSLEARNPFRTIQAAILTKRYDEFFKLHAQAAMTVSGQSKTKLIPTVPPGGVDEAALAVAQDDFAVRIIAHLFIIASSVGYTDSDRDVQVEEAVNIVGYIEMLTTSGNTHLAPLYSTFLPKMSMELALARVLIDVVKPEVRARHVKQMKTLGISLADVLSRMWAIFLREAEARYDSSKPLQLKRSVVRLEGSPGKISAIKPQLVGHYVPYVDERLIRCLHWHHFLEGDWATLCSRGLQLHKHFLREFVQFNDHPPHI